MSDDSPKTSESETPSRSEGEDDDRNYKASMEAFERVYRRYRKAFEWLAKT